MECCVTGGCLYRKTTEVVRPCEENGRGAHSQNHAMWTYQRKEEEGGPWKDACNRDMTEARLKEDRKTTNRAAWRNKIISYTGDPR